MVTGVGGGGVIHLPLPPGMTTENTMVGILGVCSGVGGGVDGVGGGVGTFIVCRILSDPWGRLSHPINAAGVVIVVVGTPGVIPVGGMVGHL